MVVLPELSELLKCGVHFGHKKSKRHPKMAPFIFTTKDEVNIIDLAKTLEYLKVALDYMAGIARNGGTVLFVGTKRQGSAVIMEMAQSCGMPYVNTRWLGGTLTNFAIISKMIKKFKKLKERQSSGELAAKYTKKEQLDISREIDELDGLIGGIQDLVKLPEVVFILDLKKEPTALAESRKRKIPIVALCDTNTNPEKVDYPIPANDDAVKSITLLLGLCAQAINEGKGMREKDLLDAVSGESQKAKPAEPQGEIKKE